MWWSVQRFAFRLLEPKRSGWKRMWLLGSNQCKNMFLCCAQHHTCRLGSCVARDGRKVDLASSTTNLQLDNIYEEGGPWNVYVAIGPNQLFIQARLHRQGSNDESRLYACKEDSLKKESDYHVAYEAPSQVIPFLFSIDYFWEGDRDGIGRACSHALGSREQLRQQTT